MTELCKNCEAFNICQLKSTVQAGTKNGHLDLYTLEQNQGFKKCPYYGPLTEVYFPVSKRQQKSTK